MKKSILIILVLSIIVLGTTGCDVWKTLENDKDLSVNNILEKLDGCWKSKDKLAMNKDGEEINLYLCFFDNKVMYTGYKNYGPYEVEIYSLTSMYFGNQTWTYEYIDENGIIFWDNKYDRISNVNIEDFNNGNIYNK